MVQCRPPNIPDDIYDLMVDCWNIQDNLRPSFADIDGFLQRKCVAKYSRQNTLG